MKNINKLKAMLRIAGIVALAAVIGFSMIACGDEGGPAGGGDSALNGTWVSRTGERLVLNNGSVTWSQNNTEFSRGTYSAAGGNNITGNVTQFRGSYLNGLFSGLGLSSSSWYTQQQLRTAMINIFVGQGATQAQAEATYNQAMSSGVNQMYASFTGTYTATTLTITLFGGTTTYNKQ